MSEPSNARGGGGRREVDEEGSPAPPTPFREDGIARNTVFALLVQATTTLFTAITVLVLVRVLGPDEFGVFALALSIAGIASILARCGVPGSVERFVAENRTDPDACAGLVRDGIGVVVVTAGLSSAALFVAATPIASAYDSTELVWPLRIVAISLFAETLMAVYIRAFIALARISVNLRLIFLESITETTASVALVVAGMGAAGAAFGRTIGYVVGAAFAALLMVRVLGRATAAVARRRREPRRTGEILRYAAPMFVLESVYGVYARVDVLIIGAMLSTSAVGLFAAPARLLAPLGAIGSAVSDSVSPRQAASAQGRRVDAFTVSLRFLVILHAAMVAPLVVWADPITVLLFGDQYAESADVLRYLAPFVFLSGIAPLVSITVNFLGYASQRIPIAVAALVTNVVIDIVFLPRIGVIAAAIGTSIAMAIYVPAHLEICRRALGFPLRPLLFTTARSLAAAAAMGAMLVLIGGTDTLSLATAVLGAAGGLCVFGATLLLTAEVSRREVREGARWVRTATSRLRRR